MPPAAAPLSPSAHVDTFTRDHRDLATVVQEGIFRSA